MTAQISPVGEALDDRASERLKIFAELLGKWNQTINLVSARSLPDLWTRHIDDSLQLLAFAPDGARLWADLGSGGGLPGAIVAIAAATVRPEMEFVLVESDQRKAAFLRTVSRETAVAMRVLDQRIESLDPLGADVLSARALAPLVDLCGYAATHLTANGLALFPKGAQAAEEIGLARMSWSFDLQVMPSRTDPEAKILLLKDIVRV